MSSHAAVDAAVPMRGKAVWSRLPAARSHGADSRLSGPHSTPPMTVNLIHAMAIHVGWTAILYAVLTVLRAPAVWGLWRRPDGSNPWATHERRASANLSNQFEWPLFFHCACVLLIVLDRVDPVQVALAWIFVAGRLLHSAVQVCTTNVRLRGLVFTINFLAVLGMWAWLLWAPPGAAH